MKANKLIYWTLVYLILGSTANANIVGSDFQSFNPTSDGLDFVTVQSARTLPQGYLGVGGFLDYASNTLPPALDANKNKFNVYDHVLSADLHAAIGLMKDWDLGANVSYRLDGHIENSQLSNYFSQNGLNDIRLNTKYRLFGRGNEGVSINLTADIPLLLNDPFYGGGGAPAYDAELIGEMTFGHLQWGVNAGYRIRNPGTPLVNAPYEPIGNQFLASTALAYHFAHTNWTAIGELFAAAPTASTTHYTQAQLTAIEPLLGVKYWGFKSVAVQTGVTSEFSHGTSSPDFRIYAGLTWYPLRMWGGKPTQTVIPPPRRIRPAPAEIAQAAEAPAPTPAPAPIKPEPAPVTNTTAQDTTVFDKEPEAHTERFVVRNINFPSGQSEIPPSFKPFLLRFADYLAKGRPVEKVTIYGHTDSQGSAVFNEELSLKRAESVKNALMLITGLSADKFETVGMGASSPVASNDTPDGRSLNRRVEFKVER